MSQRLEFVVDDPNPDETIYSLVSRFHILSGNPRPYVTEMELLGDRPRSGRGGLYGFRLLAAAQAFPADDPLSSVEYLANHHSALPYFTFFFTDRALKKLAEVIRDRAHRRVLPHLGLQNSPAAISDQSMVYCPDCVSEDLKSLGYAFWHISHQLPFVVVCFRHRTRLVSGCGECGPTVSAAYDLRLPSLECIQKGHPPTYRSCSLDDDLAHWVARTNAETLEFSRKNPCSFRLSQVRSALISKGFRKAGGIDLAAISKALAARFHYEKARALFSRDAGEVDPLWFRHLFLKRQHRPNTLQMLLVSSLVVDSIADLESAAPPPPTWESELPRVLSEQGSIAEAARVLKRSYAAVTNAAVAQGLLPKRQPPSSGMASSTDSTDPLDSPPPAERAASVIGARALVLEAVRANPDASRREIAKTVGHRYFQLMKQDRDWMEATLPPSGRGLMRRRLREYHDQQWAELSADDAAKAADVRAYAAHLRGLTTRPERISRHVLLNHVKLFGRFYKDPDRIPLTVQAVKEEEEASEAFIERKLTWQLRKCAEEGPYTTITTLALLVGMPHGEVRKREGWISEVATSLGLAIRSRRAGPRYDKDYAKNQAP